MEPAMPTEPKKPLIVISYAHEDEPEKPAEGEVKWLSFVTGYLRPAIKHSAVDLWLDRLMPGGADWEREIEQKLRACDIFILLVSRHSLSSDYVVDKEIAIIRERQGKGEAVHFYPLVLTPTPKIALDLVRDKNLRPRDGKPLSDYPLHERYRHINEAADEMANIAAKIAARQTASTHGSDIVGFNTVSDQLSGFASWPILSTRLAPPTAPPAPPAETHRPPPTRRPCPWRRTGSMAQSRASRTASPLNPGSKDKAARSRSRSLRGRRFAFFRSWFVQRRSDRIRTRHSYLQP